MSHVRHVDGPGPSLLDRLVDDAPDHPFDPTARRVDPLIAWRDAVLRDLHLLFNTPRAGVQSVRASPSSRSLLEGSVLRYGLPPLAGRPASSASRAELAHSLADAIGRFEPRLISDSIRVLPDDAPHGARHRLRFRIEAALRARPMPVDIGLRTDIDLDSGRIEVSEGA
jgi:type VI secretion system protein ImpF